MGRPVHRPDTAQIWPQSSPSWISWSSWTWRRCWRPWRWSRTWRWWRCRGSGSRWGCSWRSLWRDSQSIRRDTARSDRCRQWDCWSRNWEWSCQREACADRGRWCRRRWWRGGRWRRWWGQLGRIWKWSPERENFATIQQYGQESHLSLVIKLLRLWAAHPECVPSPILGKPQMKINGKSKNNGKQN